MNKKTIDQAPLLIGDPILPGSAVEAATPASKMDDGEQYQPLAGHNAPQPAQEIATVTGNQLPAVPDEGEVSLTGRLLNIIDSSVHDPNADVAKVRALLDMQNEVLDREAKQQFMAAFARMQPRLPLIPRNGIVQMVDAQGRDKGSYDFAKFEDEWVALQPILAEFGFSVYWNTKTDATGIEIIGTMCHEGGHSKDSSMILPPDTGPGRNPLQARGSTVMYGKRYVFENMLNLVRTGRDDDGVEGGKVYLTEEQIDMLVAELKRTGRQESRYLETMTTNARTFSECEAEDFPRLLNTLKSIPTKAEPKQEPKQ